MSFETGRRTISTTGVQIFTTNTSERADTGIQIFAASGNTDTVYIGTGSGVTADTHDDTDGYPLAASEKILIPERNPNDVFAIAGADGQKIWFIIV
jgi:hypothetical protein